MQTKQTSEKEIKRALLSLCVLCSLNSQRDRESVCHDFISHQLSREIGFCG